MSIGDRRECRRLADGDSPSVGRKAARGGNGVSHSGVGDPSGAESFPDLLVDPDEGLVLCEDLAEELRRSLAKVKVSTCEQTSSLSEVLSRLASVE